MTTNRGLGHQSHSADEALARIDRGIEEAAVRATRSQEFVDHYAALSGTGASDRGDVNVTVGPEGLINRLSIADSAASMSGAAAGAAILAANTAAIADLRQRATTLTADTWGAGSATSAAVADDLPRSGTPQADGAASTERSAW